MRLPSGVAVLAAVAALAACSFGMDEELRAVVDDVAPARSELVECGWGSSTVDGQTDSWYGCVYWVRGDVAALASALRSRLAADGWTVACLDGAEGITLAAARGPKSLLAAVSASGGETPPPPGHARVEIAAAKGTEAMVAPVNTCV